jgi:PAS domain S-box-containing protein
MVFERNAEIIRQNEPTMQIERENAQKYLDIAGVMIVALDAQGIVTLINKKGIEILGYSEDEIIGEMWFDNFVPKRFKSDVKEVYKKLMAGEIEPVEYYENPVVTKGGEERIIAWHNSILKDEQGNCCGILTSGEDVTEKVLTENALRENEERFRVMAENTSDWIWEVDTQGVFTYSSPKIKAIIGYDPEEVLGKTPIDFIVEEQLEHITSEFRKIVKNKEAFDRLENINLHKNGSIVVIETSGVPIIDSEGNYCGFRGMSRDITERKETNDLLFKNKLALDSAEIGFWEWNILTGDTYFNERYFTMAGYEPNEMPHTYDTWKNLVHPDDFDSVYEVINKSIKDFIDGFEVEFRFRKKDGNWLWIESRGKILRTNESGEASYVVGVHLDISERKHYESAREQLIQELEDKNAELERFTYTVSHDLKSPLITIKGFLGMLGRHLKAGNQEKVDTDISKISNAADTMRQLLDELLELSRIGRVVHSPEEIDMRALAHEAVELVEGRINERSVEVQIQDEMPTQNGDRRRLLEVYQNLIDNAVKFMGDQTNPCIEIGAENGDEDIVFFVRDNGEGIDLRYHDNVFGLFNQLDNNIEGTGIGLTLVKRIIETNGGRIWVESEGLGTGATFFFTLQDMREQP